MSLDRNRPRSCLNCNTLVGPGRTLCNSCRIKRDERVRAKRGEVRDAREEGRGRKREEAPTEAGTPPLAGPLPREVMGQLERSARIEDVARARAKVECSGTSNTWANVAKRVRRELTEDATWYMDAIAPEGPDGE